MRGASHNLFAIAIALLLAIAAAAVRWGWWRSPVPTFLILTAVLHGMLLGVGLMWLVGRLGLHCRVRRIVIGVLGGVVSVAAFTFGQFVSDAYEHRHQTQRAMVIALNAPNTNPNRSPQTSALDDYDRDLLKPMTGYGGIIGYVRFRDAKPGRSQLRAVEAVLVIGIATALCVTAGRRRGARVE